MNDQETIFDRFSGWLRKSVMLKLVTILILMLLLLIPAAMIKGIIEERESLSNFAQSEVSSKWAGNQLINGPVLSIPMIYEVTTGKEVTLFTEYLHILPEDLAIKGAINPQQLKRGIYEMVVYRSSLECKGTFLMKEVIKEDEVKEIRWKDAFLTIGISDLRGIENNVSFNWGGIQLKVSPGSRIPELISSGITIALSDLSYEVNKIIEFDFNLNLQGSYNLSFIPLGNQTNVSIHSEWPDPSFNGNFLPDQRDVSDKGFNASWQVLQLNRNFPQQWIGNRYHDLDVEAFGVDLILPVDDYQKSMRSAKYAAMTFSLTFLVFFLVEILKKRKIHPFQYILVGLGLCLFYILLVSITEHSNFTFAYVISALTVIILISLYSLSIFNEKRSTLILTLILTSIYGFLFVTLQLVDYALLMGSLGLTLILALTMYFTRNINWYHLNTVTD